MSTNPGPLFLSGVADFIGLLFSLNLISGVPSDFSGPDDPPNIPFTLSPSPPIKFNAPFAIVDNPPKNADAALPAPPNANTAATPIVPIIVTAVLPKSLNRSFKRLVSPVIAAIKSPINANGATINFSKNPIAFNIGTSADINPLITGNNASPNSTII